MRELRWYLEHFLDYPFDPEIAHAECVLDALQAWGTQAFNALFDRRDAPGWLAACDLLQIRSNDPNILSWPWEALYDSQATYLAHLRRIERRLNRIPDPPLLADLPRDRVNILLVVARPFQADVRYRSIARPLVELIRKHNLPAHVDVLRPPTFDQLRDHLRAHPGHYHVLHFDGHGAYGDGVGEYSPHKRQSPQGCLIFEDANGEPDPKSAGDLSALLHEYAVPAVVLNACQSGMLDATAGDPFASVATALLQSGMRSVVAMAYSLYVSGAQVFLPAFYRRLFEVGSAAEAVRAGRQEMLAHKDRVCVRGRYPLQDWLLPVLYQQDPLDFSFAAQDQVATPDSRLPAEVRDYREPYGFIGRDGPILEMERALHRNPPAILIQGLGGVGKTTLARGFLRWLDETGGLDAALWFDFRDIRTAEYVINQTGQKFYGENFAIQPNKLELLARVLNGRRVILVWDNFESAATNLTNEDRAELARFLDTIRGGRSKVIITSRSEEEWLGPTHRFKVPLPGLDGEERWEYCETILRDLGLKVNRDEPELSRLMDQLRGHPLAMRVVLPKLEQMSAEKISGALQTNIVELRLTEQEAALRFFEHALPEDLRPLLALVGLHEGYVNADHLEAMAKQIEIGWARRRIDRLTEALSVAGLFRKVTGPIHEMHPLLTSHLRPRSEAAEPCQRAFVDLFARFADAVVRRPLHEQRIPFLLYGGNFYLALVIAARLSMDEHLAALTESLGHHSLYSRNFGEASRLYARLAEHHRARGNSEGEATAYHQLGIVAEEQRDFVDGRAWYLKSLALEETRGNLHGTAISYQQLGSIAHKQQDFVMAREWYLKSRDIKEKLGNLPGAAITYHQLGRLAEDQRDLTAARDWYLKSLAIKEKQGDHRAASVTYHQLGIVAQYQQDFAEARVWYLKCLAIEEKHGDQHGAAGTYHQLAAGFRRGAALVLQVPRD
jgi:tetratricopeptide (TPR) repeat protein